MLPPPLPKVTEFARYVNARNSSTCAMNISMEVCYNTVLNSKWHNWYWSDIMYGQPPIYFFAAGLALFAAGNLTFSSRQRMRRRTTLQSSYGGVVAWIRSISSRQWRLNRKWGYTLTLGQTIIVLAMILFFSLMTLMPKPYYWPNYHDFGFSPPIATRTGFLAIGILPFQVMFATKWNFVTYLTGASHEKLQVYHRWAGWIMYVLALIHTFPFIIVDRQAGILRETWRTDWYTVSGVMCLIPQTGLVLLSIGVIRDRYYETFKSLHYIMAAMFIVILFLHCGFTLTSAYYFIGLAAAYTLSILIRWFIVIRNGPNHRATIDILDARMFRVNIPTTKVHWKPGQHFFVRFFTGDLHSLVSHPFTVASIPDYPSRSPSTGEGRTATGSGKGKSTIELYVKYQCKGGTTMSLAQRAWEGKDVRVLLDGPYGGVEGDLSYFDHVLLIAGGSGGTFILSVLRHLANMSSGRQCQNVILIYSCHTFEAGQWMYEALQEATVTARSTGLHVKIYFHISSSHSDLSPSSTSPVESLPQILDPTANATDEIVPAEKIPSSSNTSTKGEPEIPSEPEFRSGEREKEEALEKYAGRPDLIRHVKVGMLQAGTVGVACCGPKEMIYDVRNTVAEQQVNVAKGLVPCTECYLHTEVFGW